MMVLSNPCLVCVAHVRCVTENYGNVFLLYDRQTLLRGGEISYQSCGFAQSMQRTSRVM